LSTVTRKQVKSTAGTRPRPPGSVAARRRQRRLRPLLIAVGVVAVAIIALGAIYVRSTSGGSGGAAGDGLAGRYAFQVGNPGPGKPAPPIKLPSTAGGMFDLASLRGQTVLLYFQEGIMCQPCWDQLQAIEATWSEFQALGIDRIVSITTDPLDALKQKVALEQLTTPILSDPGVGVSKTYEANKYGMMGMGMNGHSFVVVGKDGVIEWRRDYGGEPKYTMYVPVPNLLADLRAGDAGGAR